MPTSAVVALKVYNVAGQEVASLAKNEPMGGRYHERTLDASNLASGQYTYRLVANTEDGNFKNAGKVILMK